MIGIALAATASGSRAARALTQRAVAKATTTPPTVPIASPPTASMRVACADGARAYVPCPQLAWSAARIAVGFGKMNAWMFAKPTSSSHRTSPPTKTITAGR